ncbi:MAG: RNA polymerase sigma factor [Dokdonella sp.]
MSDELGWLDAARRGERDAFRPAVDAYSRPLFVLCMRITRDAMLAEDAVQEAFFNAYRNLDRFDGRSSFKTWLHRIAVNAALEQLRRHGTQVLATPVPGDDDDGDDFLDRTLDETPRPDQHVHGVEIGRRIADEMERLTPLERAAFVMRHHEGESLEVIGRTLSLNNSASKQAIFRAVRKLRGALEPLRESS